MLWDIVVCIKQVPHPDYLGKIALDPVRGTITREGIPGVINPLDRNALEAGLQIRHKFLGRLTVLTMGPPQARRALEDALAMGADSAVHLCDRAFAEADSLSTAQALAYAIHQIGHFDLVLCGDTTVDSGTGQVAVQLAEILNLPAVTSVEEIVIGEGFLQVKRAWEKGYARLKVALPAVIAVNEKINQPRLASIMGIMATSRKEIKTWCPADVRAEAGFIGASGSPTRFYEISQLQAGRHGEILQGVPEETVAIAVEKLRKLELL